MQRRNDQNYRRPKQQPRPSHIKCGCGQILQISLRKYIIGGRIEEIAHNSWLMKCQDNGFIYIPRIEEIEEHRDHSEAELVFLEGRYDGWV